MKNQYFGDKRDLFKFHLVLHIMESLPHLKSFTYIPMLTPRDNRPHGAFTAYGKPSCHEDLYEFLQKAVQAERDIRSLRQFFASRPFQYGPYQDDKELTEAGRAAYFQDIPSVALRDALILFDPDIGLEVNRGRQGQYLRYDELKQVLGRAGEKSVLMIFQYFRYSNDELGIAKVRARLASRLPNLAIIRVAECHDGNVAFFFVAQDRPVFDELEAVIANCSMRVRVRKSAAGER